MQKPLSHLLLGSLALTLAAFAGHAEAKLAKAGDASVSFSATGPGGLKIVGTTSDLRVTEDASNVIVAVPLKNLDTKIELRNKHMREKYLEVDKYPEATLTVARSELKLPAGGEVSGDAGGTMKIHGREHAVRFHYTAKKAGDKISVSGTTRVSIKDYGIEEPSFMGASVKPDVDVNTTFTVADN